MKTHHGKIIAASNQVKSWEIQSKQNLPLMPFEINMQRGQINSSAQDYFLSVQQSLDGIWQAGSLKKMYQAQGKLAQQEQTILERKLVLELQSFYWQWYRNALWLKELQIQDSIFNIWNTELKEKTKSGNSAALELTIFRQKQREHQQWITNIVSLQSYLKQMIGAYTGVQCSAPINPNFQNSVSNSSLSPIFFASLEQWKLYQQAQNVWINSQKIPVPYVGLFNQQLDYIPGFYGFNIGLKIPFQYGYINKENEKSHLLSDAQMALKNQELLELQSQLVANIEEIKQENILFNSIISDFQKDQYSLQSWLETGRKTGNQTFIEQMQLFDSYWNNEFLIWKMTTKKGELMINNQFLTK